MAVDGSGDIFIADTGNCLIREVSNGEITTVAGAYNDGNGGYGGDGGRATSALLSYPTGVAIDSSNNLFIADENNNRIREVSNGEITTIAGNGDQDYGGDGEPATSAELNCPFSVAVDASGDLYMADWGNSVIREVTAKTVPTVKLTASVESATYGDPITFTASPSALDADGDIPTGTIAIFAGATYLGEGALNADGVATVTTTETPAGNDSVTVRYSGDENYATSTSNALSISVTEATPVVGLASSANPTVVGQPLTLTAILPADASGTVTFSSGSTVLGTASLAPTPCYALQFDGTQGGMTTTLAADPSQYLDLTLSSWVEVNGWSNDDGAGNNCASSIIACFDGPGGGFNRGFGLLTGGDWEVQVGNQCWDTEIPVTTSAWHYVSVVYSESNITFYCDGDAVSYGSPGTFGPYSSTMTLGFDDCGGCAQWLNGKIEETTVFGAALSESQEDTLYNNGAGVYGSAGIPNLIAGYDFDEGQGSTAHDFSGNRYTGTILPGTLWSSGKPLGDTASLTTSDLPFGIDAITASYSGDANYMANASSPLLIAVKQATPDVGLASSAGAIPYGAAVTFTANASATDSAGDIPTGSISFFDGASYLGSGALDTSGDATLTTSTLNVGDHDITAVYDPGSDPNYVGGSANMVQDVDPIAEITGVPTGNVSPTGSAITLGATVSGLASGQTATYTWQATDDNGNTVGPESDTGFTFTPTDDGTCTVTLVASVGDCSSARPAWPSPRSTSHRGPAARSPPSRAMAVRATAATAAALLLRS